MKRNHLASRMLHGTSMLMAIAALSASSAFSAGPGDANHTACHATAAKQGATCQPMTTPATKANDKKTTDTDKHAKPHYSMPSKAPKK